jgi:hypothetical protein
MENQKTCWRYRGAPADRVVERANVADPFDAITDQVVMMTATSRSAANRKEGATAAKASQISQAEPRNAWGHGGSAKRSITMEKVRDEYYCCRPTRFDDQGEVRAC